MAEYSLDAIKLARKLVDSPEFERLREDKKERKQRERKHLEKIIDERIENFKKRKTSVKKLMQELCEQLKLSKKRRRLLTALSKCEHLPEWKLKEITGSENIRSLVRDTNKRLKTYRGLEFLCIRACRESHLKKHYTFFFQSQK